MLVLTEGEVFTSENDIGADQDQDDSDDGKDHRHFSPDDKAQDRREDNAGVAVNGQLGSGGVAVGGGHQKLEDRCHNAKADQLEKLEQRARGFAL